MRFDALYRICCIKIIIIFFIFFSVFSLFFFFFLAEGPSGSPWLLHWYWLVMFIYLMYINTFNRIKWVNYKGRLGLSLNLRTCTNGRAICRLQPELPGKCPVKLPYPFTDYVTSHPTFCNVPTVSSDDPYADDVIFSPNYFDEDVPGPSPSSSVPCSMTVTLCAQCRVRLRFGDAVLPTCNASSYSHGNCISGSVTIKMLKSESPKLSFLRE